MVPECVFLDDLGELGDVLSILSVLWNDTCLTPRGEPSASLCDFSDLFELVEPSLVDFGDP